MLQIHPLRMKVSLFVLQMLLLLVFFPLFSIAQVKTISGNVTDQMGHPVPNISVTIRNSTGGTSTDSSGNFKISAAVGAVLEFSSVTHESFSLTVDNRNEYKIALKQKVDALTDVVVVGYGKQKKVNLVGAVSMVTVDEKLVSRALPNISSG